MSQAATPRILCVDDEPNVLEGIGRTLRRNFDVTTALGGEAGLAVLETEGPFAVVMSDVRMPEMDGIIFLTRVRERWPDTVRVLLTGYADVKAAIGAVNEGAVFRFLTKPSSDQELNQALAAAADQHRLITAERVLLEQTLHGSIKAVTDVLALVNPAGFGRAIRARTLAGEIGEQVDPRRRWQVEIAAMLSQVGSVTLPAETVQKLYRGDTLNLTETLAVARLPKIAADLVANIPRMEEVQGILMCQDLRYDGSSPVPDRRTGEKIPLGARILKLVLDFDILESQGTPAPVAITALQNRTGWYDPALLEALSELKGGPSKDLVFEVELRDLRPGAMLADDVRTETGILLVARGQEVSERMVDRIRTMNVAATRQVVRVTMPNPAAREVQEIGVG